MSERDATVLPDEIRELADACQPKLVVVYRPTESLIEYVGNAKRHEPEQISAIAASMKEFKFTNPILLDGKNGVIAGHGRLMAAKKLEMAEVPTIDLAHLTDVQRRAYVLADNRLGEVHTSWDFDMVSAELEGLQLEGFGIELTGFDDAFILGGAEEAEFPALNDGDREPFQQVTFTVHDEQKAIVDDALMKARTRVEIDTGLNENSNGNALAAICEAYLR